MVRTSDLPALAVQAVTLRRVADVLMVLADKMEVDSAASQLDRDVNHEARGALGAADAATYCGVGVTTLRGMGPPPKFVGARVLWLRQNLDAWLAELPVERTHARGRQRSEGSRGANAKGL